MVKFIEVYQNSGMNTYSMRQITINPAHVVAFREDYRAQTALTENRMPSGLSHNARFTTIFLNSGQSSLDVVVADPPDVVEQKILNAKRLLKG